MYVNFVFMGYIFAIFLALTGISLIVLVIMKNRVETTKRFKSVRNFSINILLISILYFFFYYRENVLGLYEISAIWRVIDYILCGSVFCLWLFVIGRFKETKGNIFKAALVIGTVRVFTGAIFALIYMDYYYYITNIGAKYFFSYLEVGAVIVTLILIIWYTIVFIKDNASIYQKRYTAIVSGLIMIWDINQVVVDIGLYWGKFGISAWQLEKFDPTGPIMIIIAFATFLFVFKEDFSPLYFIDNAEYKTDSLDVIAQNHRLTIRECEVMKLVYDGFTNPEIAEELYISRNTVKKHIQNIYEKTGVSNRMELIHLINSKTTHMGN